ncbi:hypothetical protein Tco_1240231 [Tanacetum coccineum]
MPNANNIISFTIDKETITYIVDMFRSTLQLPVETPDNPYIELADLKFVQRILKIVGYEGIVDKRLEENYHSIKDDILVVSVYTLGNVTVRGVLILGEFLSDDIRATMECKEYEKVFVRIDIPTIQPQSVESTQGTNRTPRATRTPTPTAEVVQKKRKSKAVARESSTPRKSLKVTIKQKKPSTTSIPPPSDDRERDEIAEATILSLTKHKTALAAEAQENVAKVQEKILEEDIEKMVDGEDEDSYASAFADSVFQDEEDTRTRIEPGSHKENPKVVDDDDVDDNVDKEKKDDDVNDDVEKEKKDEEKDDDDKNDDKVSGSLETRNEQTQTPIPSPPRSPRNDLSSDKTLSEELTANVSPTPDTTSKDPSMSQPTSSTSKCKMKEMSDILNNLVLEFTVEKTNLKEAIPRMVNDAVKKDREIFADVVPELVSKEFATHALKIIKELFKRHMENKVLNVHPTVSISTAKTTADLKQQLYSKMKKDLQAQAADPEMWDVLKKKFEKSPASASLGKVHDAHQGCSMKRPPLLEANRFCFWKTRFETYVKSKDIDLWQVIQNGDFDFKIEDSETKMMKETSYELLKDNQKKQLDKNNEAKMTLYIALPRNSQVKNCKIDLLTQEYDKSGLLEQESREKVSSYSTNEMESQASDGVASTPIEEKVLPIALKANVTRGQTSNDSVCQDGSDDDKDKKEEFTLIVKNL